MVYRLLLFLCIGISPLCAKIAQSTRSEYASKMHQAFALQSVGKATQAFFLFQEGYQQAIQAGESLARVEAIHQLFYWYRKYGSSLKLMVAPSGISDEYRRPRLRSNLSNYESEWGKSPEQAGRVRDLMFAFGEIISAVLCVTIATPPIGAVVGGGLFWDGVFRIWNSVNELIVLHEISLRDDPVQALKKWEITAQRAVPSNCPCE